MFEYLASTHPNATSLEDPHHPGKSEYTFSELYEEARNFASGLASLGVKEESIIAQFSDNSSRWLVADQGVMMNGAANAVRGATSSTPELAFILQHSGASGLIVQDGKVLEKVVPYMQAEGKLVRFVVLLWGDVDLTLRQRAGVPVVTYENLIQSGKQRTEKGLWERADTALSRDALATLVYTSGTSGTPKAAKLSHGNILFQVESFPMFLEVAAGERALSLLPPWHIYERTVAYHLLSRAARIMYSSVAKFKRDLASHAPHFLCCVPLLLERLHSRVVSTIGKMSLSKRLVAQALVWASVTHIKARRLLNGVSCQFAFTKPSVPRYIGSVVVFLLTALGHQLAKVLVYKQVRKELGVQRAIIVGGGSLAPHVDDFFEALSLPVLNGWGLTESSPVIACRSIETPEEPRCNVRGTVGHPCPDTDIKIVDPENLRQEVPDGTPGLLLVKGPGIMSGYWQDNAATEAAFVDGYLNTGDLGTRIPAGNLMSGQIMLTGRAKDTIILLDGENVAPQPIEDALCRSALVEHAMVIGQDKRTLGALVCLSKEEVKRRMQDGNDTRRVEDLPQEELNSLALAEVTKINRERLDRQDFEVISAAQVSLAPFSVDGGTLTQTLKLRRNEVAKQYAADLAALTDRIR